MSKSTTTSKTISKAAPARGKSSSARKKNMQPLLVVAGLAILILIVAVLLMQRKPSSTAGFPAEVSVQEARELAQNGAFFLDVRTQEEWNEVHAEGATLIPLDQLEGRVNEVPKDQQVVIICRSGNRSAQARDLLRRYGFTQVTSVAGGTNDWRAAGFPTVSGP